ncbi:hypothetical protein CASFOL_021319 [Castilleja foliolosa]|uniref:Uncharacterized protein n=1 Tax=Castilleja foliolosa TaxID=1961234 RepID=A0ABD3CW86_9LAMI
MKQAFCVYGYPEDWEMRDRQPIFNDHLREAIGQVDGLKVEDIDMARIVLDVNLLDCSHILVLFAVNFAIF